MGFFNFGFDKEGPGVPKDAPKKKGIFLFFELLGRKFGGLCKINMLYFLVSIPMILIDFFAASFFARFGANILGSNVTENPQSSMIFVMACIFFTMLFLIFLGSGSASAALSFFNRSAIREQHTYIVSDFFDNFKKNFKQGIVTGIISPLVSFLLLFCIMFYFFQYFMTKSLLWFAASCAATVFFLVFTSATFYIYPLMITFENSVMTLYKNAILLSLANMPWNLLVMIITLAISYLIAFSLPPVISILVCFFFYLAVMRFAIEFHSIRVVEKLIKKDGVENK